MLWVKKVHTATTNAIAEIPSLLSTIHEHEAEKMVGGGNLNPGTESNHDDHLDHNSHRNDPIVYPA